MKQVDKALHDLISFANSALLHHVNEVKIKAEQEIVEFVATNTATGKFVSLKLEGKPSCQCTESGNKDCLVHPNIQQEL